MTGSAVHPLVLAAVRGVDIAPEIARADWECAAANAVTHGVTASLEAAARRSGAPDAVLEWLRARRAGEVARALLQRAELAAVLEALRARQIRVAPLRGVALADRLYGDATARPAGDLDLLVDKRCLPDVAAALAPLGYREHDRRHGFAREFSYTLELVCDRHGGLVVEPHWSLAYPPFVDAIDLDRLWARARTVQAAGVATLALAPEAVLLNLCLHLVHKADAAPLLWSLDIDRLVRRERIDWDEFIALARGAGVGGLAARTLGGVHATFGTPVPAAARAVADSAMTKLLTAGGVDGRESLALLLTLRGVRRRARYALGLLCPSAAFMRIEYGLVHDRGLPVAYARRAGRFAWQGLKGVRRLCC